MTQLLQELAKGTIQAIPHTDIMQLERQDICVEDLKQSKKE